MDEGVIRHPNGDLTVPARAESDDGMLIGDGMKRLEKGTPEWQKWRRYLDDLDTEFELYGVDIEVTVVPEYSRDVAWIVNDPDLACEEREALRGELLDAGEYSLLSPATKVRYDAARAAMGSAGRRVTAPIPDFKSGLLSRLLTEQMPTSEEKTP